GGAGVVKALVMPLGGVPPAEGPLTIRFSAGASGTCGMGGVGGTGAGRGVGTVMIGTGTYWGSPAASTEAEPGGCFRACGSPSDGAAGSGDGASGGGGGSTGRVPASFCAGAAGFTSGISCTGSDGNLLYPSGCVSGSPPLVGRACGKSTSGSGFAGVSVDVFVLVVSGFGDFVVEVGRVVLPGRTGSI